MFSKSIYKKGILNKKSLKTIEGGNSKVRGKKLRNGSGGDELSINANTLFNSLRGWVHCEPLKNAIDFLYKKVHALFW